MWDLSKLAVIISLLVLAGLFWWLPTALVVPAIKLVGDYHKIPDYYIEDFRVIEMGVSGRPKYVLRAERMIHYPHQQRTQLQNPQLTEYGGGPVTHSDADRGWISRDGKHLLMAGHVTINRGRGTHFTGANIATQRINIHLR
ncbi:MAG TPA: LPS export ABC transporter periplasmic protein LptC [Acidiferrobacteraceae bacterium]|nr:LPS export ABC transporter periplasmic protein LptC [Acidiferrobacteraceae bacterium]